MQSDVKATCFVLQAVKDRHHPEHPEDEQEVVNCTSKEVSVAFGG